MNTIHQEVTVLENGLIEVRSPKLRAGDVAEVTVLIRSETPPVGDSSRSSWEDFIGCFKNGNVHGSDNESIDRDLADSYLDKHEPKK